MIVLIILLSGRDIQKQSRYSKWHIHYPYLKCLLTIYMDVNRMRLPHPVGAAEVLRMCITTGWRFSVGSKIRQHTDRQKLCGGQKCCGMDALPLTCARWNSAHAQNAGCERPLVCWWLRSCAPSLALSSDNCRLFSTSTRVNLSINVYSMPRGGKLLFSNFVLFFKSETSFQLASV